MADSLRQLMSHQSQGLEKATPLDAVGLFWQMRLGKTIPAIRWMNSKNPNHVLVCCPREVIPNWLDELKAEGHAGMELSGSVDGRAELARENPDQRWFVTNYEGLIKPAGRGRSRPQASALARMPWDGVILDESTKIRKPKAAITKAARDFLSQSDYRALLSGLPNPEGHEDLVCQMLFLRGGEFMGCRNFWEWRQRYMQAMPHGHGWAVKWKHIAAMRADIDRDCQWLTRKQAGVGNKKVYERRWVELPARVMSAMRQAVEEFQVGDRLAMNKLQVVTWLLQLAGGRYPHDESLHHDVKVNEVVDLATGELKGERLVLWCHYTAEIEAVAAALEKAGRKVRVATGKTRKVNADNARAFQRREFDSYVCQPKVFQYGKDLSAADTEIYYSNYYDRELRTQSEDRIESAFKKTPLLVMDIVAKGTKDVDLLDALRDKELDSKTFWSKMFLGIKEAA